MIDEKNKIKKLNNLYFIYYKYRYRYRILYDIYMIIKLNIKHVLLENKNKVCKDKY